ncbi:MAG: acyl-CoA dehydrogenase family protein [bacterium]
MDFDCSPEAKAFGKQVRDVLERRISPEYPQWKAANTTPARMFEILGEEGLLGFRAEGDGAVRPIPWLLNVHFYSEAAQFSGGLAIAAFAHAQLGLQALCSFGSEPQRSALLVPGLEGQKILAFANTEPGAGSDAAAISLRAERKGDGLVLNGAKAYITNGDIADHIVLTAVSRPEADKPHARISMFVVHGEADGLVRKRIEKHGWKPSHLSTLAFRDLSLPEDGLVGEPGRGFYQTMEVFNSSRIGISALAFGTALGAYRMAFRHASSRKAFGRTLLEHESKRNEFAEHLARLQAAWLLIQKAAFLRDAGRPFRFHASMAKLFATEEALRTAHWATELFGARGVLEQHPVSEYPLDAKLAMIGEGAPEVQRKIIAENIEELLESL